MSVYFIIFFEDKCILCYHMVGTFSYLIHVTFIFHNGVITLKHLFCFSLFSSSFVTILKAIDHIDLLTFRFHVEIEGFSLTFSSCQNHFTPFLPLCNSSVIFLNNWENLGRPLVFVKPHWTSALQSIEWLLVGNKCKSTIVTLNFS